MKIIDLNRIREALPSRAKVTLGKTKKGSPFIECIIRPGLYISGTTEEQKDLDQVFDWQRDIIGRENISEFYTEETGSHWFIYLNRVPFEFINLEDNDVNTFTGLKIAGV